MRARVLMAEDNAESGLSLEPPADSDVGRDGRHAHAGRRAALLGPGPRLARRRLVRADGRPDPGAGGGCGGRAPQPPLARLVPGYLRSWAEVPWGVDHASAVSS